MHQLHLQTSPAVDTTKRDVGFILDSSPGIPLLHRKTGRARFFQFSHPLELSGPFQAQLCFQKIVNVLGEDVLQKFPRGNQPFCNILNYGDIGLRNAHSSRGSYESES